MASKQVQPQNISVTLPIAVNASYRRQDAGEEQINSHLGQPEQRTMRVSERLMAQNDRDFHIKALTPAEAVVWLAELAKGGKSISEIILHGPGDVLVSWPQTRECLRLLGKHYGDIPISITSLGLSGLDKVAELAQAGLAKITLRVDSSTPESAAKIYSWLRPGKKTIPLAEGCELLIKEQPQFCQACVDAGITVIIRTKVNDINEGEVADIAKIFSRAGAKGIELCGKAGPATIAAANGFLPAIPFIPTPPLPPPGSPESCLCVTAKPTKQRPNVAVVSGTGMEVDLHLGQASQLLIYGKRDDGLACLLETREALASGAPERWQALAKILSDCFCLLVSHAGEAPRNQLSAAGIQVILTNGEIEGTVDTLFGGGKKGKCKK